MPNELEIGVTYESREGILFQRRDGNKIYDTKNGPYQHCTDGWNRFISGPYVGMWVGREHESTYKRHTILTLFVEQMSEQLDLFDVD
jgi:hypothetical protein